jgi:hypothetical protein
MWSSASVAVEEGRIVSVEDGVSLHGELGLLVQAGPTPVQALRAATSLPARRDRRLTVDQHDVAEPGGTG